MKTYLPALLFLFGAPIVGCLLAGLDRIVSARMQSRVGPPLLQPFYDVCKLFQKRNLVVNQFQNFYILCFFAFVLVTGVLFFIGGDLLLVIFALTVASVFLILAAYSSNSPYSTVGAERELLQMMAYEPMLLLMAIGMFQVTRSFRVDAIVGFDKPLVQYLPGVFLGFLFILTIKLRKSPFDLSTSHHGHQELVKGLTTDFSGFSLGLIEIAHWYENVLLLAFVYLFFAAINPGLALAITVATYFLEVLIDNTYARLTWRFTVKSSWVVALVVGVVNLLVVAYVLR
jgi:formate hydrogenlyase subunit 4